MRLGIDLGGINIAAGLVDDKGKILLKQIAPTPVKEGADSIVATMGTLCLGLLKKAGLALEQITLCG
ncbi:MAG TPA: glucokinase, partial [Clostridiales bacterium]|nr:glucokinase [Clostridiales bacterium]